MGGDKKYLRNIVLIFAFVGLWHGAGWNFIVWGLYHAGLVIGYHFIKNAWDAMPTGLQIFLNFVLVLLGWLLFIFDFDKFGRFIGSVSGANLNIVGGQIEFWLVLALAAFVAFRIDLFKVAMDLSTTSKNPRSYLAACGTAILLLVVVMFLDTSRTFIYFRF